MTIRDHFSKKMVNCPRSGQPCGFAVKKILTNECLIFNNEQIFSTDKLFICEDEKAKLRRKPKKQKPEQNTLFNKEEFRI